MTQSCYEHETPPMAYIPIIIVDARTGKDSLHFYNRDYLGRQSLIYSTKDGSFTIPAHVLETTDGVFITHSSGAAHHMISMNTSDTYRIVAHKLQQDLLQRAFTRKRSQTSRLANYTAKKSKLSGSG